MVRMMKLQDCTLTLDNRKLVQEQYGTIQLEF